MHTTPLDLLVWGEENASTNKGQHTPNDKLTIRFHSCKSIQMIKFGNPYKPFIWLNGKNMILPCFEEFPLLTCEGCLPIFQFDNETLPMLPKPGDTTP